MGDIVKDIKVEEWLAKADTGGHSRYRMYRVRIEFDTDAMRSKEIELKCVPLILRLSLWPAPASLFSLLRFF